MVEPSQKFSDGGWGWGLNSCCVTVTLGKADYDIGIGSGKISLANKYFSIVWPLPKSLPEKNRVLSSWCKYLKPPPIL